MVLRMRCNVFFVCPQYQQSPLSLTGVNLPQSTFPHTHRSIERGFLFSGKGGDLMDRLNRRLHKLIKIYFPNCNRFRKYTVSFKNEMVAGSADPKKKEITINSSYKGGKRSCGTSLSEDDLDQLLIHELCHITGSCWHGVHWQKEYERCLEIARNKDFDRLSDLIEDDLRWYQDKKHIWERR